MILALRGSIMLSREWLLVCEIESGGQANLMRCLYYTSALQPKHYICWGSFCKAEGGVSSQPRIYARIPALLCCGALCLP